MSILFVELSFGFVFVFDLKVLYPLNVRSHVFSQIYLPMPVFNRNPTVFNFTLY